MNNSIVLGIEPNTIEIQRGSNIILVNCGLKSPILLEISFKKEEITTIAYRPYSMEFVDKAREVVKQLNTELIAQKSFIKENDYGPLLPPRNTRLF